MKSNTVDLEKLAIATGGTVVKSDVEKPKNTILVSISFGKTRGAGLKLDKKTANELYNRLHKILSQYGK